MKATRILTGDGIGVNVTLCFSAVQAILAAKAGAKYISPFIGRLDDIATNGMQLIQDIVQIYGNYGYKTEVLAASIRHPMHVVDCALAGADVATVPFKVMKQLGAASIDGQGLGIVPIRLETERSGVKELEIISRGICCEREAED